MMAKRRSLDEKPKKTEMAPSLLSRVFVTGTRPTCIGKRSDDSTDDTTTNRTWGLFWKSRRDRREIIVLVCYFPSDDDQWLKDCRGIVNKLKLNAKKTGCTCLTDSLEIAKIEEVHPFIGSDVTQIDTTHNQLVYFDNNAGGRKKRDDFFVSNIGKDTEWSLLLHRINNRSSIEDILRSGMVPEPSLDATTTNVDGTINETPKNINLNAAESASRRLSFKNFLSENSMTILHCQNFDSTYLTSIASVRLARSFYNLWCYLWTNKMKAQYRSTNNQCCKLCAKPTLIPSRVDLSKERLTRWNDFLAALFDAMLGFLACAGLFYIFRNGDDNHVKTIYLDPKQKIFQSLEDQITWLETFPAGFKLNVQLTNSMGHGIQRLIHHHQRLLSATLWDLQFCQDYLIPALATLAFLGGWSTFLAVLIDLWRFEILYVTLLAVSFRKLYQAELYLLSALFRLFRGKKRNVLRQRTDSMKYDMMQLLVGTITFCVCVFLWTTVMIYYSFFVIWNLWIQLPLMVCSILYLQSWFLPWGSLFFRFRNPNWFPKDVYLKVDDEMLDSDSNFQVGYLESILESPVGILLHRIKVPLKRVVRWYLISFLELLYPRTSHTSHSFLPLTLLVEDQTIQYPRF